MSSLQHILIHSPWIPYNTKFIQSRITLTYPENVIFTAQLVKHVSQLDVYNVYPYAEKINLSDLEHVEWTKTLIVFDRNLQLLFAPDPVNELVRLDRRLHYREAMATIFNPFRFLPFLEVFRYQWLGVFLIFFFYTANRLIGARYTNYSLALSNKTLKSSTNRGP